MMEPITGVALALTPYTCALLKTLVATGVEQGCDETFIRGLIMEGIDATVRLFKQGGFTPEQVIDMVATREGLTWSSLHTMEAYGVFRGIRMGARAMTGRSYELRGERVPDEYVGFLR
jgi:pyrroline-5-carboxylate reductase